MQKYFWGWKDIMNEYWALLSQIGLWGWIVAMLFFIHSTFPAGNTFIIKSALKWGVISICFFTFWVAGMLLA
jgi:hypothetical protein